MERIFTILFHPLSPPPAGEMLRKGNNLPKAIPRWRGTKGVERRIKYLLFSFLFILLNTPHFAQQAEGIWFQEANDEYSHSSWDASWIWLAEEGTSDVMLARKTFSLKEIGNSARLRITASSQYRLYVNGKYVARGPSRSAPHHKSFDIWEIQSLLKKGKNTLAVRVHKQKNKHSYHLAGRAGLLTQIDDLTDEQGNKIRSDASWKVSEDPSWDNEVPVISRFQMVVKDWVDMRKYVRGWEQVDFDDSEWQQATPLMRKVGWPSVQKDAKAFALTPPWTTLIARDLPYVEEVEVGPKELIQAHPIELDDQSHIEFSMLINRSINRLFLDSYADFLAGKTSLEIPGTEKPQDFFFLFDFGEVFSGIPQLEIDGPAGTEVQLHYAPFVVDYLFSSHVVFSDFRDKLQLSGKRDSWEATYFKPTRYLGILLRTGKTPISIHHVGLRAFKYPFIRKGMIRSHDAPWVEQYMEASAKTLDVCTTDAYTDNYRERRQYAQTGYYAGLGNYWTFGDHHLQRRYLIQTAQEQEANGMMPAYAPLGKDDFMIILDSNCLWIRSLRNYFLYSGDAKTTRDLLPAAQKLMKLLQSFTNEEGMIDDPPYPYWLDHAKIDRRGANLNLNGHFLGALEDFADILAWLDEKGEEGFREEADMLRKSLAKHFWDEEKGLFVDAWIDGQRSTQFSEHGNAMALAMKIADDEQARSVAAKLLEEDSLNYVNRASGMTMVTPAMSYFLHKGLAEYGYVDESFALFRRRFDKMLAPEHNGTLWEEWWLDGTGRSGKLVKTSRSDAQTESAFPPALFAEYLLGVKAIKPGMKEMVLRRPVSPLKYIEAKIPSPQGVLVIKWGGEEKENGKRNLALDIPHGMTLYLELESLGLKDGKSISINGKKQILDIKDSPQLRLSEGIHYVRF